MEVRRSRQRTAAAAAAAVGVAGSLVVTQHQKRRQHAAGGGELTLDSATRSNYVPVKRFKTAREAVRHLTSGALAGALAKCLEAPVDRIKIIIQVSPERFSYVAAARTTRDIIAREGVRGLWKGNTPVLARVVPYAAINFAAHDFVAGLLSEDGELLSLQMKFVAGAVAGMTSTLITYPLDMVRARMAVAPRGCEATTNMWKTLRGVWRTSGISGLYAGLTPSLIGIVPYSGTTWMCFNTFKERLARYKGAMEGCDPAKVKLTPFEHAVLGGTSAVIGQVVSYPLDVCRRRMQTANRAGFVALTMAGTFRDTLAKEGIRGLYKGLSVNLVKAPITHGISFATYHQIKDGLEKRNWP